MKKITKIVAGLVIFIGILAFTLPVLAQTVNQMSLSIKNNGNAQLSGTIASISSSTINVNGWLGTWVVDASSAKIVRKFGGVSSISELKSGDTVVVSGTVGQGNSLTIIAKTVRDMSLQAGNIKVSSLISNLNTNNQSFSLVYKKETLTVILASGAQIFVNNASASFNDLANGMRVKVSGVLDTSLNTLSATNINARTSGHR